MYLPITLTLVRHGQSEGNVVIAKSLAGDDSGFTPEFCAMHSSRWLLTVQGQEEARAAGDWGIPRVDSLFNNGIAFPG